MCHKYSGVGMELYMKKYALGVDIGGTNIKLGLFKTTGELLKSMEFSTNTKDSGKYILQEITNTIKELLVKENISIHEVEGVGLGVPGPVGEDGTVFKCVNLGWQTFNVVKTLENMLGVLVRAGNDANVAALGESWQGGGKGYQNIVMVTLGTGVGGGVIIDGKIVSGIDGAAGEIGHLHMIDSEEATCGCGKKSCLEQYASANGLVWLTKKYVKQYPKMETVLRSIDIITAKDILDAAKNNDAVALTMVDKISKMLGKALAQIACVINPEAFVIGGGMSKAGTILLEEIQTYYKEYVFHAAENTKFKQAILGNEAGIYGAVKLILKEDEDYEFCNENAIK